MKSLLSIILLATSTTLLVSCAGTRVVDTQVASGAANPRAVYIRPFSSAGTEYTGETPGGPGEKPIRQSLLGRQFAEILEVEMDKFAPSMVIAENEIPEEGWIMEGAIEIMDEGSRANRYFFGHFGAGRSKVLVHVRVREVNSTDSGPGKNSGPIGRSGNIIYEFDVAGGSRANGKFGTDSAGGITGPMADFDFANAAERIRVALTTQLHRNGQRTFNSLSQ